MKTPGATMRSPIKAAWDWLPVIVRAIVLGFVVLTIGSMVTFLPLLGNLKFHPEIPRAFPMILVMLFGIIALVALRLLLPSLMLVRAPSVSIPLSSYPLATVIGALLSIAAIAAVTEEIAFRGYMQKPLEEAYGIVPAVLIVGIMFWIAHLDHGITI